MSRSLRMLHDRATIAGFYRTRSAYHHYELGDLDEAFWPYTTWFALCDSRCAAIGAARDVTPPSPSSGSPSVGAPRAIALLYSGDEVPCLLAVGPDNDPALVELMRALAPLLPRRCYAHLAPHLSGQLPRQIRAESAGIYQKMSLNAGMLSALQASATAALEASDDPTTTAALTHDDLPAIQALYAAAYPHTWFEPHMLDTGCYFGIYGDGALLSIAGVHVFSPQQRVAALGNIATHPEARGRGLARCVTAALCQHLAPHVDHIGLNVKADNASAIRCYESRGFEFVTYYEEAMLLTD